MKRSISYIVAAVALSVLAIAAPATSKPGLPVSVTLAPVSPAQVYTGGEVVELLATVRSVRPMRVRLEFRLKGGARLVSGDLEFLLDIAPGKPALVPVMVKVPAPGGKGKVEVYVRNVKGKGRRGFVARDSFSFAGTSGPSGHSGPGVRKGPEGRNISEYPVGR